MISKEEEKVLQNAFTALGKKFVQVYCREKNFKEGNNLLYALMAFQDFMVDAYNCEYSYIKHKIIELTPERKAYYMRNKIC